MNVLIEQKQEWKKRKMERRTEPQVSLDDYYQDREGESEETAIVVLGCGIGCACIILYVAIIQPAIKAFQAVLQ